MFCLPQAISIYSQPIVREGAVQFRQAVDTVVIPNVKAGKPEFVLGTGARGQQYALNFCYLFKAVAKV